jgi:hypothetical protein
MKFGRLAQASTANRRGITARARKTVRILDSTNTKCL